MESRVSQYASRLIETGWLAAVITTPVFFNVWSNRVFEPDKLTLLRTLALVMAAAGIIWLAERGLPSRRDVRGWLATPLVAPVFALTAVYALSTVTSTVPRLSLMGSYQRLQGLYTWLAYVIVFVAIVTWLRRRGQLDRLLTALILPSLPVALYGIIQNRGLDPMPWLGDVTFRVASTMGNSIFVAAYLILVVPLTITRIVGALRDLDDSGDAADGDGRSDNSAAAVLRAASYMVLLIIQVVGIVLSQSRGPLLGLGGALFFLALAGAALRPDLHARRLTTGLVYVVLGLLPVAFLVAFNVAPADSAMAGLRDVPYVGRMGRVLETEGGTGRVRVLIWQGATQLITDDPVRMLIGYGPESMHVAYNPYYPPELGGLESRNASPDRSHNETLDALVTTGVIGFLAYMLLFTSLFYYALKWLGFIADARQRNLFLAFWLGGGILSVAVFYVWAGAPTFFGVALPAGMVAGLVHYVVLRALVSWPIERRPGALILVGLTAAVVAHFIEIHFGIAIAATRTVFFAMAGTLVVVGALAELRPGLLTESTELVLEAVKGRKGRRTRRMSQQAERTRSAQSWTASAFIMLVLLITMTFDFVVRSGLDRDSAEDVQSFLVAVWLFTLTWAIGSLMLGSETVMRPFGSLSGTGRYLAVTLGGFFAYLLVHEMLLGGEGGADTSATLLLVYYFTLMTVLAVWAFVLTRADPEPSRLSRARALWAYPALLVGVVLVALFTNINEVRADIYYKQAWAFFHNNATNFEAQGDRANADLYYSNALENYDRAESLDGGEDYYLLFEGKALLERADNRAGDVESRLLAAEMAPGDSEYEVSDPDLTGAVAERDAEFEHALGVLEEARTLAPRNTDHYANLGRAYQIWGERTFDPAVRAERFGMSLDWFDEAIAQSPNNASLRTELATTLYLAGDTDGAFARIDEALALDDGFGRPYRLRATIHLEADDLEAAERDYVRYVETRDGRRDAVGLSGLAYVQGMLGKTEDAIATNQRVLELAPGDMPTLRNLALLHRDIDDLGTACQYVQMGLDIQPQDPGFTQVGRELGCGVDGGGASAPVMPLPAGPSEPSGEAPEDAAPEADS